MSYTHVPEPLRFDGIHVAVLTGDNGHGKSALLDAITWALWGRARGRSVDELIHTGASEMEVEFEFALHDQQYRVIRKRQRRGKSGYSDLQLAVLGDGVLQAADRAFAGRNRAPDRTHAAHELRDLHQLVVRAAGARRQLHHHLACRAQAHPGRDSRAGLLRRARRPRQGALQDTRGATGRRTPTRRGLGARDCAPTGVPGRGRSSACRARRV